MKVPDAVIKKAARLIKMYGEHFEYLGYSNWRDCFRFQFPEGIDTGFPFLYLYDASDQTVKEVTGLEALDTLRLYVK